ncbi:Uncharacterized protein QTN25_003709 [Entamoeba marina]
MDLSDIESNFLNHLQQLHYLFRDFDVNHAVITSRFILKLKQIVEASKLVVETTKIITREIFLNDIVLKTTLVQLAMDIVSAYMEIQQVMNSLKHTIVNPNVPSIVLTNCEIIATNTTHIYHIFNGSSFSRLHKEAQQISEKLSSITTATISNYNTLNVVGEVTVLLHTHLSHLITQMSLAISNPHKLHSYHVRLSNLYESFVSVFDEYLNSKKSEEKEEQVFKCTQDLISLLTTEVLIISPIHALTPRPWRANRFRSISLLQISDVTKMSQIISTFDFPNIRTLPLVDSLQTSVSASDFDGAKDIAHELKEFLLSFDSISPQEYSISNSHLETISSLSTTFLTFISNYFNFNRRRELGLQVQELEDSLIPQSFEHDILLKELHDFGDALRYSTPNSLYLVKSYLQKLRFLGGSFNSITNKDEFLNAESPEMLQNAINNLQPCPFVDSISLLQQIANECIVLDILITSTDYHDAQFTYLYKKFTTVLPTLSTSARFLSYSLENPTDRAVALMVMKDIETSIRDISLFLSELIRVKTREEKDWLVKHDILKYLRAVSILKYFTIPSAFITATNCLDAIKNDVSVLSAYREAGLHQEVEWKIQENVNRFITSIEGMPKVIFKEELIQEIQNIPSSTDDAHSLKICKDLRTAVAKHCAGDAIKAYLNICIVCAQRHETALFECTYHRIQEKKKVFTYDEQFLFNIHLKEFLTSGRKRLELSENENEFICAATALRKAIDNCFIIDEVTGIQAAARDVRETIASIQKGILAHEVVDSESLYKKLDKLKELIVHKNWIDSLCSELPALFTIFIGDKDLKHRILATLQLLEVIIDRYLVWDVELNPLDKIKNICTNGLHDVKWGYISFDGLVLEISKNFE